MNNSSSPMTTFQFRPLQEVLKIPRVAMVTVFLFLLDAFILVGNFLVLWTIYKIRRLRYSAFYFVASLAVADFLLGMLVLPVSLAYHVTYEMNGQWIFGPDVCKAWLLGNFWFCSASVLNLSLISWDRYVAVTSSLRYQSLMSDQRVFRKIGISWFISLFIAAVLITGERNKPEPKATCTILHFTTAHSLLGAILVFTIPVLLLIFVNSKVWVIARRHQKRLDITVQTLPLSRAETECTNRNQGQKDDTKANRSNSEEHTSQLPHVARAPVECSLRTNRNKVQATSRESTSETSRGERSSVEVDVRKTLDLTNTKRAIRLTRTLKKEIKTFKTFLIVLGAFIACWTPFYVVLIMNLLRQVSPLLFYFTILLSYCNSAINVVIYAVFSQEFRKALKESLKC